MEGDRLSAEQRARREFALPPLPTGTARDPDELEWAGADQRSERIRSAHPDLARAIDAGAEEVRVEGAAMNPRLHLTMHEIVANQLWDDDPPEMWQTAARLSELGYEHHEVLHMLARTVSEQVWNTLHDKQPYDADRHRAALAALPESWEAERAATGAGARAGAGKGVDAPRAARRTRRSRRRGRRDRRR